MPSNNQMAPPGTVIHGTAGGRSIPGMRQAIFPIIAKFADFLHRRKTSCISLSSAGYSPGEPISVIALVTGDDDRRLLVEICRQNRWRLLFTDTCEEARIALDELRAPVILCDRVLPGRGWRETVQNLASSPHRTCIILVSEVVDTYLWNEVVRTGGYDVLSKPLREDDVVRAVRLAWLYWKSACRRAEL